MVQETCKNCGAVMGAMETAYLFQEQPVCAPCYRRLRRTIQDATPVKSQESVAAVEIQQAQPVDELEQLVHATQHHRISRRPLPWYKTKVGKASIVGATSLLAIGLLIYVLKSPPPAKDTEVPAVVTNVASSHAPAAPGPRAVPAAVASVPGEVKFPAMRPSAAPVVAVADATDAGSADPSADALQSKLDAFSSKLVHSLESRKEQICKSKADGPSDMSYSIFFTMVSTETMGRSESKVHPLVGVLKMRETYVQESGANPRLNEEHESIYTATLAPMPGEQWKCVKAEELIESDRPAAELPTRVGQVTDQTSLVQMAVRDALEPNDGRAAPVVADGEAGTRPTVLDSDAPAQPSAQEVPAPDPTTQVIFSASPAAQAATTRYQAAVSKTNADYPTALAALQAQHGQKLDAARKEYVAALKTEQVEQTKLGNLDVAIEIRDAAAALEKSTGQPADTGQSAFKGSPVAQAAAAKYRRTVGRADVDYPTAVVALKAQRDQQLDAARKDYIAALKAEQIEQTKKGNLDLALQIKNALAGLEPSVPKPVAIIRTPPQAKPVAVTPKKGDDGWLVIFRSADPSIWNTNTDDARGQALALAQVPGDIKWLRLAQTGSSYVIIAMKKDRLGVRSSDGRFGWEGTAGSDSGGRHLGIFDNNAVGKGAVSIAQKASNYVATYGNMAWSLGPDDFGGWGFGHRRTVKDRQGFCWNFIEVMPAAFEIAIKATDLTTSESQWVLVHD